MEELKKCPFCGGKAELITNRSDLTSNAWSKVRCKSCYAETKKYYIAHEYSSDDLAVDAWNRRAYETD